MRQQQLKPGQSVADLNDSGDPSSFSMVAGFSKIISDVIPDPIKILTGNNQRGASTFGRSTFLDQPYSKVSGAE